LDSRRCLARCSSSFSSTEYGAKSEPTDESFPTTWADCRRRAGPAGYGCSVGHWEDDYSFVVDTVGNDERSWLDIAGHPHSIDLRAQERYRRLDHNNLELAITIDDPKTYTKPFIIGNAKFGWIPQQDFEEQICVPSEMFQYLNVIANPAGEVKGK
jgi:hypothetical protein